MNAEATADRVRALGGLARERFNGFLESPLGGIARDRLAEAVNASFRRSNGTDSAGQPRQSA